MPKFHIHGEKKKDVVSLRLVESEDEAVKVIACDEHGNKVESGNLIVFKKDGTVRFPGGVNASLGFEHDHRGAIKVVSY